MLLRCVFVAHSSTDGSRRLASVASQRFFFAGSYVATIRIRCAASIGCVVGASAGTTQFFRTSDEKHTHERRSTVPARS